MLMSIRSAQRDVKALNLGSDSQTWTPDSGNATAHQICSFCDFDSPQTDFKMAIAN